MRNTPHYQLARAVLEGRVSPTRARGLNGVDGSNDCAFQMYEIHAAYENSYTGGIRDPITFVHNVAEWNRSIDQIGGHIEIVLDTAGWSRDYIVDGAHRAAFLAAYNDVHQQARQVYCLIVRDPGWGRVTELVDDIYPEPSSRGHDELRQRRLAAKAPCEGFFKYPSSLLSGQRMTAGQSLVSPNGSYRLTYQSDGNLCIYNNEKCTWSAMTNGTTPGQVLMQPNGNFVIYIPGRPLKGTMTAGNPNSRINMQDDGNLVVYDANGHPTWASKSCEMQDALNPINKKDACLIL
jgi:hypothetical protein